MEDHGRLTDVGDAIASCVSITVRKAIAVVADFADKIAVSRLVVGFLIAVGIRIERREGTFIDFKHFARARVVV